MWLPPSPPHPLPYPGEELPERCPASFSGTISLLHTRKEAGTPLAAGDVGLPRRPPPGALQRGALAPSSGNNITVRRSVHKAFAPAAPDLGTHWEQGHKLGSGHPCGRPAKSFPPHMRFTKETPKNADRTPGTLLSVQLCVSQLLLCHVHMVSPPGITN